MPQFKWTDEIAAKEVLNYKSRRDIYEKRPGLYEWLRNNNKLDKFMPINKWDIDKCLEEAKKIFNKKRIC